MLSSTSLVTSLSSLLLSFFFLINRSVGSLLSPTLCPLPCDDGFVQSTRWTTYHDLHRLRNCEEPMLLDFSLHNAHDDPHSDMGIRACSMALHSEDFARDARGNTTSTASSSSKSSSSTKPTCGVRSLGNTTAHFSIAQSGVTGSTNSKSAIQAIRISQYRMTHGDKTSCSAATSFIMVGDSVVGIYAGTSVSVQSLSDHVLESLVSDITNHGAQDSVWIESCSTSPSQSSQNMGIVIGGLSTLPLVQSAMSGWSSSSCMTTNSSAHLTATAWQSFNLPFWSGPMDANHAANSSNVYMGSSRRHQTLAPRGDCTTVQVASSDSCASLATKCGVSAADFTKYNSNESLCATLSPGQHVCCSAGTLPDLAPKLQADGTCTSYTVATDDTCTSLASSNSITVSNINNWYTAIPTPRR